MQFFCKNIAYFVFFCYNVSMFNFVYKDIDFAHKLDKPSHPTEEYYKHIHHFYEILFLVRGNIDYTVESETHKLSGGDIVFIAPGKFHYATVDLSVPYERYVFKFPERILPSYILEKLNGKTSFFFNSGKFSGVFAEFDLNYNQFSMDEAYTVFLCELIKLVVRLCHDPISQAESNNDFISRIIDYINANLGQPITMQTLTDKFHYSKSYINIEFKRQMKIPIMKYIRLKKILAAHKMIAHGTKKSVAAEMFGFENYSTFYRAYKNLIQAGPISEEGDTLD